MVARHLFSRLHRISAATLFLAGLVLPAWAQNPEQQARIAFKAGKLALESNQPAEALTNFEEVLETLGPFPELLFYAAKAAFESGDAEKAQQYVEECFSASDEEFEETPESEQLYELAAQIKLGRTPTDGRTVAGPTTSSRQESVESAFRELADRLTKTPWFERCDDGLGEFESYKVFRQTGPLKLEKLDYTKTDAGIDLRQTLVGLEPFEGDLLNVRFAPDAPPGQLVFVTRHLRSWRVEKASDGSWALSENRYASHTVTASSFSSTQMQQWFMNPLGCPIQPISLMPNYPLPDE